jgi:hypothetical protein
VSEDHQTEEPRRLHGAAAAAQARKVIADLSLEDFLDQLAGGIEDKLAEARQIVETKRTELEAAERTVRTLQALQAIQHGEFDPSPAAATTARTRGRVSAFTRPRGETANRILDLLQRHPDGMNRGQILEALGMRTDKSAASAASNALVLLRKQQKIGNNGGVYSVA